MAGNRLIVNEGVSLGMAFVADARNPPRSHSASVKLRWPVVDRRWPTHRDALAGASDLFVHAHAKLGVPIWPTSELGPSLSAPKGRPGRRWRTAPSLTPVDPELLREGLTVEWLGDDSEPDDHDGWLRRGQPGLVTDPAEQDVFVQWAGLEDQGVSRWICYGYKALGVISKSEYDRRVLRVRNGLPPVG